jgi:hypothetical protein
MSWLAFWILTISLKIPQTFSLNTNPIYKIVDGQFWRSDREESFLCGKIGENVIPKVEYDPSQLGQYFCFLKVNINISTPTYETK